MGRHDLIPCISRSYWTKRRKIVESVDALMQESSQSDTQSDVTAQPLGLLSECPVSTTACSSSPQAKLRADGSMSPVGECDGLEFASNDFVSEDVPLSCDSDASECGLLYADDSSVSDESRSSGSDADEGDLPDKLSSWAVNFNISKDAVRTLLHTLHPYHPNLPKDSRTLLKAPDASKFLTKSIAGGSYYHFGVSNGLKKLYDDGVVQPTGTSDTQVLQLQINVDGPPVYKSTNYQLWPILGTVVSCSAKVPFVTGMFGGHQKPGTVVEYLCDFVEECRLLEQSGILLGESVLSFKIHTFLCDAPARAFVRNTKGHTGYYGCDR